MNNTLKTLTLLIMLLPYMAFSESLGKLSSDGTHIITPDGKIVPFTLMAEEKVATASCAQTQDKTPIIFSFQKLGTNSPNGYIRFVKGLNGIYAIFIFPATPDSTAIPCETYKLEAITKDPKGYHFSASGWNTHNGGWGYTVNFYLDNAGALYGQSVSKRNGKTTNQWVGIPTNTPTIELKEAFNVLNSAPETEIARTLDSTPFGDTYGTHLLIKKPAYQLHYPTGNLSSILQ